MEVITIEDGKHETKDVLDNMYGNRRLGHTLIYKRDVQGTKMKHKTYYRDKLGTKSVIHVN